MNVPDNVVQDWIAYETSNSPRSPLGCLIELLQLSDDDKSVRLASYLSTRIQLKQDKLALIPAKQQALQDDIDLSSSLIDSINQGALNVAAKSPSS